MPRHHFHSIEDDHKAILSFLESRGIKKVIAFSGGANSKLDMVPDDDPLQERYRSCVTMLEERVISDAIAMFRHDPVAILTGGTRWGVPNTAVKVARQYQLPTIGVFPEIGQKYALPDDMLDLSLCVHPMHGESRWGDESPLFASVLDASIVFGGSAGTLVECAHILKLNESLIKHSPTRIKLIVPISGTGGVADGLPFIWSRPEVRSACIPSPQITSGRDAAALIRQRLLLDDYFINGNSELANELFGTTNLTRSSS